jgi:adenosylhomocysteine nucleosidase
MSANSTEFGFVAALEREVSGLVRGWRMTNVQVAGAPLSLYRSQNAALVCAGTGVDRAYTATKLLIEKCSPRVIISIGFAGSCVPHLHPGSIVVPATLLEAATGRTFPCAFGCGQLVTLDRVAGKTLKHQAWARFGALAVDMEAAGVAAAATEHHRDFAAIKAISDGADEDLGFLSSFVKPEGFATGRFVAHIAVRPGLWPSVAALNRNSKLAVSALQSAVAACMSDWRSFSAQRSDASFIKESG